MEKKIVALCCKACMITATNIYDCSSTRRHNHLRQWPPSTIALLQEDIITYVSDLHLRLLYYLGSLLKQLEGLLCPPAPERSRHGQEDIITYVSDLLDETFLLGLIAQQLQ